MADRPEMFRPSRGFSYCLPDNLYCVGGDVKPCSINQSIGDGRFSGTMQNVVGPTLVAMATKFGLGAEIESPTGLFCYGLCQNGP